jgi:uncharacterized protein involved in exopolysaccharide biosynthesis
VSELRGLAVHFPPEEEPSNGFKGGATAPAFPQKTVASVRLVWEHRRMFFRVALYSLLASTVLAFLISKRYEATAQIMPPEGSSGAETAILNALNARGVGEGIDGALGSMAIGGIAGNLMGLKSSGALFVSMMGSRTITDRIIEQFNLDRVYHTPKIEDTRLALWHHIDISEDRKSGVLSVTVTDTDPQRAAAMAQAYVTELNKLVVQVSTSSARRERIFLEERLKAVKADLDNAVKRFSEFSSENAAIDVPTQSKVMVESAAGIQGQLIVAESQLQELQQIYASGNIRVRALQARIEGLKKQLQKLGGSESPEENNPLYPSIRKLPLLGVTYFDLYREYKIQETVYALLTQQYEMAKVEEARQTPSINVLDTAVVPTKKSFPPRRTIVMLGTSTGVVLAAVWLFVRRWWNTISFDDPGRQLIEEIGASTWTSARRFVTKGFVIGWITARLRSILPGRRLSSETEEDSKGTETTTRVSSH